MKKFIASIIYMVSMASYANTTPIPEIYEVYDLTTNKVLISKSENEIHSIASLTKLMTAYVFLKHYPDSLSKCISHISSEDNDTLKNTHSRIVKNKTISCENLLQIMLVVSDNYAASALAGTIKNISREDFFALMNKEAKQIGMKSTFYKDSSGLSFENKSTANDLVKLVKVLMKNEKMKEISGIYGLKLNTGDKTIQFKNSNKLIREGLYSADISKTGYISESGYNLIFVPKRPCGDKKLALIVMGAKSSQARASFSEDILKKYKCEKN